MPPLSIERHAVYFAGKLWRVMGVGAWLSLGPLLAACSSDSDASGGAVAGQAGSLASSGAFGVSGAAGGNAGSEAPIPNGGTAGEAPITSGGSTSGGGSANGGAGPSGGGGSSSGAANGGSGSAGASHAGGSAGASAGMGGAGAVSHSGVWKVMPLGDSITGSTCYPQLLSQQFKAGGHTNFQFVGKQTSNQNCSGAPNINTEGHGGYGVTYLPADSKREACTKSAGCGSYAELKTWAAEKPDMVLMHYGTNDVWDGQSTAAILSAYVSVVSEFRKQNPNVVFFVSKIIKLNPTGCGGCASKVSALAAAVTDDWAASNTTATSPIHIVDDYDSGFDPNSAADSSDHVHPLPAGAAKVATATYKGVSALGYF